MIVLCETLEFRGFAVAVRIRMKQMGRTHRHYYRIVAIDARQPRDGKVIEELGTYDPHIPETDSRVTLRPGRIKYWQGVGARASDQCQVLFDKYSGSKLRIDDEDYLILKEEDVLGVFTTK